MAQQVPPDRQPIFLIAGPTASGKSALAVRLAERLGGEIVNADALQLYADLRLLTARPSDDEQGRAPHHLYGVADGIDGWSTGRWLRAAAPILGEIADRDRPAIVVGGTGLYFRALTEGLADIPAVPEAERLKAQALFDVHGENGFRAQLAERDPAAAARIAPGDRQRLVRAAEVLAATGRSLSDWQADTVPSLPREAWRAVALEPPRPLLYAQCDARFDAIVQAGALEEVRRLMDRRLDDALPIMKAVGVRELAAHLDGRLSLDEAVAQAKMQTRRYAKRQSTWLRNQAPDWPRLSNAEDVEAWLDSL